MKCISPSSGGHCPEAIIDNFIYKAIMHVRNDMVKKERARIVAEKGSLNPGESREEPIRSESRGNESRESGLKAFCKATADVCKG